MPSSVVSGDSSEHPLPRLAVEADESTLVAPSGVLYSRTEAGIEVSGRVEKQWARRGRIPGHVDIALVDGQGRVLGRYVGVLQYYSPSRRNPDWASFAARIEPLPEGAAGLRVAYDSGG